MNMGYACMLLFQGINDKMGDSERNSDQASLTIGHTWNAQQRVKAGHAE